jgi:hypothetical protein
METARDSHTLELIEAEELWAMLTVDSTRYICRGCAQQVFPASYDKTINKKRPYFKLGPRKEHLMGCDVDGEAKIVNRAKKERVGTSEGFPMPFPNRLTLTDQRLVEGEKEFDALVDGRARTRASRERAENAQRKHHGHTVTTIRMICRAYMKYPNDRPYMPLSVPGVNGGTYSRIFKFVWGKPEPMIDRTRLFYAPIRWTVKPVIHEEYCELTLSAGERDEATGKYKSMYRVRVHWASWNKSRRETLIREYETTREEARQQAGNDNAAQSWLFFVGTQDEADPSVFHVEHFRLICSLSGIVERARGGTQRLQH